MFNSIETKVSMQDSSLIYLALPCHLVLGKENPGNVPKRLEQFLEKMIQPMLELGLAMVSTCKSVSWAFSERLDTLMAAVSSLL